MNRNYIKKNLKRLGIDHNVMYCYDEPHRYYHNMDHIIGMLKMAKSEEYLDDELFLAIVFHDIVYDSRRNDNEERSSHMFHLKCRESSKIDGITEDRIIQAIIGYQMND